MIDELGENKVREFLNEKFGEVRTIIQNEELWFIAKDVCLALEYSESNVSSVVNRLDDEQKTTLTLTTSGNYTTNLLCVNEDGLYDIVMGATRKPKAKPFRRWITKEVIPALRKDGMYVNNEENIISEEELIKSVEEKLEQKILRKFGKGIRRDLTDTIEENWQIRNRNQFATYTDQLINIPVLGCKSKQYKKENEIGDREALRDYLDIEKLDKVIKQEQDIATLVDYGLDYYQIKELVHKKIT